MNLLLALTILEKILSMKERYWKNEKNTNRNGGKPKPTLLERVRRRIAERQHDSSKH